MRYEKPELVAVDFALALVLGEDGGTIDNGVLDEHVPEMVALGLDD